MNKAQKKAWLLLAISLATLLIAAIVRISQIDIYQPKTHRILGLFMTIPVILFFIVSLCFRRKVHDERDLQIWRKALISGGIGALGALVGIGIYYVLLAKLLPSRTGPIRPALIIHFVYLACFISLLLSSVAVLIQYGRGGKDGEE